MGIINSMARPALSRSSKMNSFSEDALNLSHIYLVISDWSLEIGQWSFALRASLFVIFRLLHFQIIKLIDPSI